MNTQDLMLRFAEQSNFDGYDFQCAPLPEDADVLEIIIDEFAEMPCYLSVTDDQVLCITYLWRNNDIKPETRVELLEEMMELNVPMPLSAFARIGGHYVLFGALAITSTFEDVCHEIITLSKNAVEAIEDLGHYLK